MKTYNLELSEGQAHYLVRYGLKPFVEMQHRDFIAKEVVDKLLELADNIVMSKSK